MSFAHALNTNIMIDKGPWLDLPVVAPGWIVEELDTGASVRYSIAVPPFPESNPNFMREVITVGEADDGPVTLSVSAGVEYVPGPVYDTQTITTRYQLNEPGDMHLDQQYNTLGGTPDCLWRLGLRATPQFLSTDPNEKGVKVIQKQRCTAQTLILETFVNKSAVEKDAK